MATTMTGEEEAEQQQQQLSDQQMEELKEHFHIFDLNGSGWIEEDDLKQAFELLGQPKDNYEIRKLLQSIDTNTDKRLSFDEYIAWNRQLFIDEMKAEFQLIDKDGSGSIDKTELRSFVKRMGYEITEEELDEMTYQMDITQDDRIGVEEFIAAMVRSKYGQAYYVINGELYSKKMEADFNAIDTDGSGFVNKKELRDMANSLAYAISEAELDELMESMDEDNDGRISLQEFIAATVKRRVQ